MSNLSKLSILIRIRIDITIICHEIDKSSITKLKERRILLR